MYKLNDDKSIIRKSDGAYIPKVEGNKDYDRYLEWVSEGNTPDPVDPPVIVVPQSVTPLQARKALLAAGLLIKVKTIIATADEETQLSWEYATEFTRNSPVVLTLGAAIGLDSDALDNLFIEASKIMS